MQNIINRYYPYLKAKFFGSLSTETLTYISPYIIPQKAYITVCLRYSFLNRKNQEIYALYPHDLKRVGILIIINRFSEERGK